MVVRKGRWEGGRESQRTVKALRSMGDVRHAEVSREEEDAECEREPWCGG